MAPTLSNGKRTEPTPSPLKDQFKHFLGSLGEALNDITALEVNTMVVSQITGNKFVPELAYQEIYNFTDEGLAQLGIPKLLHPRYKSLRNRLEVEYQASVHNPNAKLPDPQRTDMQQLMAHGSFLRALRKINEIKAGLNSNDPTSETTDIIFAQTVLQLDGDIINRYHEKLLTHPQKDLLIKIHQQGVTSGEQQWHGLLEFMVNLVQAIMFRNNNNETLLPWNGKK